MINLLSFLVTGWQSRRLRCAGVRELLVQVGPGVCEQGLHALGHFDPGVSMMLVPNTILFD